MNSLPWVIVLLLLALCVALMYALRQKRRFQATSAVLPEPIAVDFSESELRTMLELRAEEIQLRGGSFCLYAIGLDNFQAVLETFGKSEGERIAMFVGDVIVDALGKEHGLSRVAASEFAAITSGGSSVAIQLAKKIQNQLLQAGIDDPTGVRISLSIGLAVFPEHGSHTTLHDQAQIAMRNVRVSGGDGLCVYDHQMGVAVRQQAQLVRDLRLSIERDQLTLYFQPKIDVESLQVTACEALLRWNHPQRGFISPAVFIPLAEQHGFMAELGKWVITQACIQCALWRDVGLRMPVAVNISGAQMREAGLVSHILHNLSVNDLRPTRFTCEITESVAMEDTDRTRETFNNMRNAGLKVSIDDFGTGYSSLAMLRKLPATELKLDRAFVLDLEESEDARAIARSVVQMANALGLRVVAEGVETAWQRDYLVTLGCAELQGFLFSMPVPAAEITRLAKGGALNGAAGFSGELFEPTALLPLT